MKAKYEHLKAVHTRYSQSHALVASAKERGEVTGEKHRVTSTGMTSTVITLADTSKMSPDQITALKSAVKVVNAGSAAQTALGFRIADLAEAAKDIERMEARIAALESGGPKEVPQPERAPAKRQA